MLFLLRISVEMMLLVVLLPPFWVGLVGLGAGAYLARRQGTPRHGTLERRRLIGWGGASECSSYSAGHVGLGAALLA
jgi:hypothetical protein